MVLAMQLNAPVKNANTQLMLCVVVGEALCCTVECVLLCQGTSQPVGLLEPGEWIS